MASFTISDGFLVDHNETLAAPLRTDLDYLGARLTRHGLDLEALVDRAATFTVAVPSWGVGTGGTRFARFPGPGEPRNVFEKVEDCGTIHQLIRITGDISLHIPVGRTGRRGRAGGGGPRARPPVRRGQLQHLPGPARPAALLQVRQPHPRGCGRTRPGRGAQPPLHRGGPAAGRARSLRCGSRTGPTFRVSTIFVAPWSVTWRACG